MAWSPFGDPFADIERTIEEMRQRVLGLGGAMGPSGGGGRGGGGFGGARAPMVDVVDERNQYEITADLPGVDKNEIDINVDERSLTIKAQARREERRGGAEEGYLRQERKEMSFFRVIPLPEEVKPEEARANYRNGVLHVVVPKKHPEERHGKRVRVE